LNPWNLTNQNIRMKKHFFLLLLFFICIIRPTVADCIDSGISVWPNTNEFSLNSVLIIEGFGNSQNIIRGLNSKHKIYLKSDNGKVSLEIIKIYEGQYGLTQALLKPAGELIVGSTYTLEIDSLDAYPKEDSQVFTWIVTNNLDNEAPVWKQEPTFVSKHKMMFGCGPEVYVNFCVCIQDKSPVAVLTKLKDLKTGKVTEYLVTPESTLLRIGHNMCSGAFDFENDGTYEITFSLMDACGNKNETFTKAIQFTSPAEEEGNSEEKVVCGCLDDAEEGKIGYSYPDHAEGNNTNRILPGIAGLILLILISLIMYWRRRKR